MAREIEVLTEEEAYERYDEMLDECYPDLMIAGLAYCTSDALKHIDAIAYRVGFNDWVDGEMRDGVFEVEGY